MANKISKGKYLNYRGFEHMDVSYRRKEVQKPAEYPKDGLMTAIFAPDPQTMMPSASAMLQIQNGTLDPSQKEMLRRKFLQPVPSDVGAASADDAIKYTKSQYEAFDKYVGRIVGDIEEHAGVKKESK